MITPPSLTRPRTLGAPLIVVLVGPPGLSRVRTLGAPSLASYPRVTVEQAGISALARWIESRLLGVTVFDNWPEPDVQLAMPRVTITRSSAPVVAMYDPQLKGEVKSAGGSLFTWQFGYSTTSIQLDVWAASAITRDSVSARLFDILNVGALPMGKPFEVDEGVIVPLSDGWDGTAAAYVKSPEYIEESGDNQRAIHRAMLTGEMDVGVSIAAPSKRIARIVLNQQLQRSRLAD